MANSTIITSLESRRYRQECLPRWPRLTNAAYFVAGLASLLVSALVSVLDSAAGLLLPSLSLLVSDLLSAVEVDGDLPFLA